MTNIDDKVSGVFLPHGSEIMVLSPSSVGYEVGYLYRDSLGSLCLSKVFLSMMEIEDRTDDDRIADQAWEQMLMLNMGNSAYRDGRPALMHVM